MHTSNLLKLLSKLNEEEWKRFDKFVRSPYFNTSKSVIQLFDYLKKYHPNFDSPKLEKEKVFEKLVLNQAYKEKRMWQMMSDLKGLAEQFLVVEKNSKHKQSVEYQIQLKEAFLEKDLYDWFEQKSTALEKKLVGAAAISETNEFYLHQLHDSWYYNNHSQTDTPSPTNLIKANSHLQYYFHFQQLRYACEWASRSYRIKEDIPFFVQSINYRAQYGGNPLYQLYYDTFLLFYKSQKEVNDFEKLTAHLKISIQALPKKHQIALLLYLINYGGKRIQLSEREYIPILFDLYKLGLADYRLIYKGTLSIPSFLNIISIASKMKAYEWLKNFTKEFAPFLPEGTTAAYLAWAEASIFMQQGQYPEAVQVLNGINFKSEIHELSRRSLQIRACLGSLVNGDLSYYELLRNKSLSFEKYLSRKGDVTLRKKGVYRNLNKAIRSLAKLIITSAPKIKFSQFYHEIANAKEIAARDWLLNQIQKIKFGRVKKSIPSPKMAIKPQSNLH